MNYEGVQGLVGFVAITVGVIPLGQLLLVGRLGSVWSVLPVWAGAPWLLPTLVVLAGVIVIGVLERRRRAAR